MERKWMIVVFILTFSLLSTITVAEQSSRDETVNFIYDLMGGCSEIKWSSEIKWNLDHDRKMGKVHTGLKNDVKLRGDVIVITTEFKKTYALASRDSQDWDTTMRKWKVQANLSELNPDIPIEDHEGKYSRIQVSCISGSCWNNELSQYSGTGGFKDMDRNWKNDRRAI